MMIKGKNQIFSDLTQYALRLHEPHVTWTILWYFAYFANFPWFYNSMSEYQNVSNIHQHGVRSQRHGCFFRRVVFRQEGSLWKGLKQLRSMCMWFNKSRQKLKSRPKGLCLLYFEVALQPYHAKVDLDFRFAQNHTLSLLRICLHDWRLIFHDLRRIGSKWSYPPVCRGNRTW